VIGLEVILGVCKRLALVVGLLAKAIPIVIILLGPATMEELVG